MSKPVHGLGKGLGALLDQNKQMPGADKGRVQDIAAASIKANRYQPRTEFDERALEELKESIQQYGILQPLIVRKLGQGYELIAGERRFRAAKLAGLRTIPVIVRDYSDMQVTEIALIENLQRENLNAIEEGRAYECLLREFNLTQEIVAQKVGRSRSHVANFLRLLKLSPRVQEYVADGSLSMGQAKPLLALTDDELQLEAADYILTEELSSRQIEALVKHLQENPDYFHKQDSRAAEVSKKKDVFLSEAENQLKLLFGTQVKISQGKKKSKIEIEFYSSEDLDRIIETLTKQKKDIIEEKKDLLRKVSLSQSKNFTV